MGRGKWGEILRVGQNVGREKLRREKWDEKSRGEKSGARKVGAEKWDEKWGEKSGAGKVGREKWGEKRKVGRGMLGSRKVEPRKVGQEKWGDGTRKVG